MSELDEVLKEFLIESHENLDQLDRDLVTLEKDPRNRDGLASIFRTVHTIKGTCGFFDLPKLGVVAHAGENLLGRLRDGRLLLDAEITSGLLALIDALRAMLGNIENSGREGDCDYTDLIARLTRLQEGPDQKQAGPVTPAGGDDKPIAIAGEASAGHLADSSIRVDVALLDKLMTLVGELVLARNQILQFTSTQEDPVFLGTSQHLNLITTELQEGVMKTRLLPIRNIWDKFPRLVRDLSLACGKQVLLELDGKETELDKSIIEAIKDPLTHLVRNAIDHGIETPETRVQRGKPVQGRLRLRAFHEGGQVNIEIADDGAGLDSERIKHKALERGLMSHEQAARLGEREILELIFLPGFSTAETITNVSGRGVGMDVVKTNIERISGSIDLQSRLGQGTTVKIKIPLTLAIIPALLVSCEGDCYAVPQVNLRELIRLEGEQARQKIEWIHGVPVYRLRGKLLPLLYLAHELEVQEQAFPRSAEVLNIVVVQADDRQFGLVVDGVRDTAEIVVKPLGKQLKSIPVFAGATILGDGKVALILDVLGLAQRAQMVSEARDRARPEPAAVPAPDGPARQALVLLSVGSNDY
ncbi:MAG TPA: chemotaxis protein CheA, partial [Gemmataceae bacterium]|nr:chemotaxis protein CheA [Gemmataceae bacterium]